MALPGIQPLCGVNVGGLLGCLRVFPAGNVLALPPLVGGRYLREMELLDPLNYADLWFPVGAGQYQEGEDEKEQGRLYKAKLSVLALQDHPDVAEAVARYREIEQFVALYLDGNGRTRLVGTPDFPLSFAADFDTGRRGGEQNGYALTFSAELPDPAGHYLSFEAEPAQRRVFSAGFSFGFQRNA